MKAFLNSSLWYTGDSLWTRPTDCVWSARRQITFPKTLWSRANSVERGNSDVWQRELPHSVSLVVASLETRTTMKHYSQERKAGILNAAEKWPHPVEIPAI